jgi:RimJ/RimL family protein N-acetyltransferase
MAFCNSFSPPSPPSLTGEALYGPDPYDVNFCFKIIPESLENERVQLIPFVPRVHGQAFFDVVNQTPELFRYLPFHAPRTLEELLTLIELVMRREPGFVLFSVMNKTTKEEDVFAGVIGLVHSSAPQSQTEIGFVVTFPAFQRTHVTSNAIGLLMQYCLQMPSATPPGLGLRRVEWRANILNKPSIAAAERMGMRFEGVLRWNWVLPEGKDGKTPRSNDPVKGVGRDSAVLAICWEDWENGGKEHVEAVMTRRK